MHDFKERLLSYISDTKVGSMREFERKCGLTNGQISSIGAQGPTASVLKKIADTCPDLDMNWLFRGEGAAHYTERVPKWSLVHSHTARKTGATLMRLNGASMREIMLVGGWSDERTLELYLRMTGEENAKVVATNPFFR